MTLTIKDNDSNVGFINHRNKLIFYVFNVEYNNNKPN